MLWMETATARAVSLLKPQIPEDLKLEWSFQFEARTAVHVYEGILVLKEAFTYAVE